MLNGFISKLNALSSRIDEQRTLTLVILSELRGTITLSLRRVIGTKEESKDPGAASLCDAASRRSPQNVSVELLDAASLQNASSGSFDFAPFSDGVNSTVDALRSGRRLLNESQQKQQ